MKGKVGGTTGKVTGAGKDGPRKPKRKENDEAKYGFVNLLSQPHISSIYTG